MGYKDDTYQTKVCGHHRETCSCRDVEIAIKLEEIEREEYNCVHPFKEVVSGNDGMFCTKCQEYITKF